MMLIIYIITALLISSLCLVSTAALFLGGDALVENPTNTKAWVVASAGLIGLILCVSIGFYIAPDISHITSFNNT